MSLPEPSRAHLLVEDLALLAVARLVPLHSARTPPGRRDLPARRASRWERIGREALKVNGASRVLEITAPLSLAAVLSGAREVRPCLLDPDPGAPPLSAAIPAEGPLPWLLVGPEGGFTEEEVRAAEAAGALRVRLGTTALRTEGAARAAAAVALCR